MQKLKNIEFLRVFLIIAIVMFHMRVYLNKLGTDFYSNMYNMLEGGRNSVEAFFIISGFFLILTFKNQPMWEFIKKKYFRLMPAAMFSIIVLWIASLFKIGSIKLVPSIVMGLLFSHFGICWCRGSNIVLWYASSLFFGLIVFYLIIKLIKEKYHLPIFLILGLGSYASMSILNHGMYSGSRVILFGIIPAFTLRALGGIGMGCVIAKFYQKYREKIEAVNCNIFQNIVVSVVEIISIGFIIWWYYFKTIKVDNSLYVLSFIILFICFLFNKGFLSNLTNKDIWVSLSKYTYSLFCIHLPIIRIISNAILYPNKTAFQNNPMVVILILFIVSYIVGVATYYLVEKPSYSFLMNRFIKR